MTDSGIVSHGSGNLDGLHTKVEAPARVTVAIMIQCTERSPLCCLLVYSCALSSLRFLWLLTILCGYSTFTLSYTVFEHVLGGTYLYFVLPVLQVVVG